MVTNFVYEHNHNLRLPTLAHLMPSQRNMPKAQVVEIDFDLAYESEIRLRDSYHLMGKNAGGYDDIGFTMQDHKNYMRSKRKKILKIW